MSTRFAVALLALLAAGCSSQDVTGPAASSATPRLSTSGMPGALFIMTNGTSLNEVDAYVRAPDGTLTISGNYNTTGTGNGHGGATQGSLVLDNGWLLAANAGSDNVSVFRAQGALLKLTDVAASGGTAPFSIAAHGSLVYVLNTGGSGNITGFRLSGDGKLKMIPGSTQGLGGSATGPAQISFSQNGRVLMVTEKATNMIATYTVDEHGVASAPTLHPSNGITPFGFAVRSDGIVVVSEAAGGAPGQSTASSYQLRHDGSLQVRAGAADFQTAACWAVLGASGRYAYIVNAGSNSISGFRVGPDGALTLLNANGVSATTAAHPIDSGVSDDGRYLYSLATVGLSISGFAIASDGSLTSIGNFGVQVPASAAGLAVR